MAESKGSAQAAERSAASVAAKTDGSPKLPKGGGKGPVDKGPRKGTKERRPNPISRLIRFIREVVAELRKVIWPTRKELITYTSVVIVFVTIMTAIVWGLDAGVAKIVMWAFGANGDS
ncbi:preprotein translocase subunit SecE [Cryptosporangium minutisporangium]|uniref:Protein translocase subunit SecE n=1 Tax=Cryptosporangium minutisporangium TaxID=113569 RepID=A0ABP6TBV2_9ACTN